MLDTLDERARLVPRGDVFLRFGRSVAGAFDRERGAELAEDSSGFTGAEGAVTLGSSLRPSSRPRPKATLTMAPYHLNIDSAVSSHSAAGVAIGVRSAVRASRGAGPSATY
jgi:hypothetical protein